MAGSIFIPLVSVFSNKGIRDAKSGLSSLQASVESLKSAGKAAATTFAFMQSKDFVKATVASARDLERNTVGLRGVFESLSPQMERYVRNAEAIGLSQVEASRATTFLGSVLKQSGFTMQNTAKETQSLVSLASDLAATYGYDVSEALTGMTALFRGEYDPIEKFGVAMKQSEVNALLAARGQRKLTGEALRLATAQARLDLLYQRSADAQGAYARQAGGLFVAQKNLNAAFENTKAVLGKSLQQPMADFLNQLTPVVDVLEKSLLPLFESMGKTIQTGAPFVAELARTFILVFDAFKPFIIAIQDLLRNKLTALTAAFQLLNRIFRTYLLPIIKIFGMVLYALGPLFMIISKAVEGLVFGLNKLLDWFESIPIINVLLKTFGNGVDKVASQFGDLFGGATRTETAINDLTKTLSYKRPPVLLDAIGSSAEDTAAAVETAGETIKTTFLDVIASIKQIGIVQKIMGDFETEVTDNFVKVESVIGEAYKSGYLGAKGLKNLRSFADKEKAILIQIAKRRDLLAQQINKATEVQSSLMESAKITGVLDKTSDAIVQSIVYLDDKFKVVVSGVQNTASNVVSAFRDNLNKIKSFYSDLTVLSSMNLKGDLLTQITEAGVESGGALAKAIIAGGQDSVAELNSIWDEIRVQAGNAGALVGSAMEDSGMTIGNGLIDGLKATQDELADLANKLATTFANKFKEKLQFGLNSAVETANTAFNLMNAPEGASIWGSVGASTSLGKGKSFKAKTNVAAVAPSGRPAQGILGRLMPQFDTKSMKTPVYVKAGEIFNPYRQNESFMQFQKFEQARLKAAEYNIEIKVAPTANAADVGRALVKAIQEYERTAGKVFTR